MMMMKRTTVFEITASPVNASVDLFLKNRYKRIDLWLERDFVPEEGCWLVWFFFCEPNVFFSFLVEQKKNQKDIESFPDAYRSSDDSRRDSGRARRPPDRNLFEPFEYSITSVTHGNPFLTHYNPFKLVLTQCNGLKPILNLDNPFKLVLTQCDTLKPIFNPW